jgi:hypothetical protein
VNKKPLTELCAPLAIWRYSFKGLSQAEGLADFSENLCASLFSKDLSNEQAFQPEPSRCTVPLTIKTQQRSLSWNF